MREREPQRLHLSLKSNSGIVQETRTWEKGRDSSNIYKSRVELNGSPIQDPVVIPLKKAVGSLL